jgi:hypothetical protein
MDGNAALPDPGGFTLDNRAYQYRKSDKLLIIKALTAIWRSF